MKKLFVMLIVLFTIYLTIEILFKVLGPGHDVSYQILKGEETLLVNEKYMSKKDKEIENYQITINYNDLEFNFQTYQKLNKREEIISDIELITEGDYTCVLPIFKKDRIIIDYICHDGREYAFYHAVNAPTENLRQRVQSSTKIKELTTKFYEKNEKEVYSHDYLEIYKETLPENHFIALKSYKGIYIINKNYNDNVRDVNLFDKDVYDQKLGAQVGRYYVVADYNSQYEFNKFFAVDLTTGKVREISLRTPISFDSYIQGVVGTTMYLIDKNSKVQYEIDLKSFNVIEVGNITNGIRFYNGKEYENRPMNESLNSEISFSNSNISKNGGNGNYNVQVGRELSGLNYLISNEITNTAIYVSPATKLNNPVRIINQPYISYIVFEKHNIYFYSNNTIYYYNQSTGLEPVLKNNEYEFNKALTYYLYVK